MGKVAIHGFGRIGRSLLRIALKNNLFTPVSVSDIKDIPTLAALFEVDTNYGRWHEEVQATEKGFVIGGRAIAYFDSMKELPDWQALGVDLVIDCTGRAVTRAAAQAHLDRGATRVLVSAPSKSRDDADVFLLPGINFDTFDPDKHKIVSMASCTTNALAPVVKVVLENFGVKYGLFSTVHAYTNTQSLTEQPVTVDAVNDAFRKAAATGPLKGIMGVLEDEWASSRIVGDPHSSIVDLPLTQVQGDLLSVAAWYDNEWGYATRLAETAAKISG